MGFDGGHALKSGRWTCYCVCVCFFFLCVCVSEHWGPWFFFEASTGRTPFGEAVKFSQGVFSTGGRLRAAGGPLPGGGAAEAGAGGAAALRLGRLHGEALAATGVWKHRRGVGRPKTQLQNLWSPSGPFLKTLEHEPPKKGCSSSSCGQHGFQGADEEKHTHTHDRQ